MKCYSLPIRREGWALTVEVHEFTVPPETSGTRLDVFLATCLPGLSRARVQRLIAGGHVKGPSPHHHLKPSLTVMEGDTFTVTLPETEETDIPAQSIPLDVVYEDKDLLVIDKPVGLVAHPGAGNPDQTLVNALVAHCPDIEGVGGVRRPGLVHRLDKDTSGLLVAAKTDLAYHGLVRQLKSRDVHRLYVGIAKGELKGAGVIDAPIGRSPNDRKKMAVRTADGKEARTRYLSLEAGPDASLVLCKLDTGRTHQIRAHLAYIRHPLLGDDLYGGLTTHADRQMLHAFRLSFTHPHTREGMEFVAAPPLDFRETLKRMHLHPPDWETLRWPASR
jgi:23S rRNA pseudouridine1911/1915/1917 synthase